MLIRDWLKSIVCILISPPLSVFIVMFISFLYCNRLVELWSGLLTAVRPPGQLLAITGCTCATCKSQLEDGRKSCLWGEFAWQPFHVSQGSGSQQGNTKDTVASRQVPQSDGKNVSTNKMPKKCWTEPMVSCQQAEFGRSQGA